MKQLYKEAYDDLLHIDFKLVRIGGYECIVYVYVNCNSAWDSAPVVNVLKSKDYDLILKKYGIFA
jgi:hypothetical protein